MMQCVVEKKPHTHMPIVYYYMHLLAWHSQAAAYVEGPCSNCPTMNVPSYFTLSWVLIIAKLLLLDF